MTRQKPYRPFWLIDLDNTLFDASHSMFDAIHHSMNEFIMERLGLDEASAGSLRREYWRRYGATYEGMWRHHRIPPEEFLLATHSFDLIPHVRADGSSARVIASLPGRKVLYTNSPSHYARRILRHLGLLQSFEAIVASDNTRMLGEWQAKPSRVVLEAICRRFHVKHSDCVLVDDSLANLLCAHRMGMRTVYVAGYRRRHGHGGELHAVPWVDHRIEHIRELPRLEFRDPRPAPKLTRAQAIKLR